MTSQCGPRRPNLNETKVRRRYDVACRVGTSKRKATIKIDDTDIKISSSKKLLGVLTDNKLSFNKHMFLSFVKSR